MRFSDRIGATLASDPLQFESIDDPLKNALWQFCREASLITLKYNFYDKGSSTRYRSVYLDILMNFFHKPVDYIPSTDEECLTFILDWFFSAAWYDLFNFIEFLYRDQPERLLQLNDVLKAHRSAYRFVDGLLVPIADSIEVEAIAGALASDSEFVKARQRLSSAVNAFSQRPVGDYRSTIENAVSALDDVVRVLAGGSAPDVRSALVVIGEENGLPATFGDAAKAFYDYVALGPDGEPPPLDQADAQLAMVLCSALANYLIQKCVPMASDRPGFGFDASTPAPRRAATPTG